MWGPAVGIDSLSHGRRPGAGSIPGNWEPRPFWHWQVRRIPETRRAKTQNLGRPCNRELASLESSDWPTGMNVFSPDGRFLALSEPDQIKLWDFRTATAPRPSRWPKPRDCLLARWQPRVGDDMNTIRPWRTAVLARTCTGEMRDVAPSRRTIGSSTDRPIRIWYPTPLVE